MLVMKNKEIESSRIHQKRLLLYWKFLCRFGGDTAEMDPLYNELDKGESDYYKRY